MKAEDKRFLQFLKGPDKHFVIPVYQRNYDWKKEHCVQLYDDLVSLSQKEGTHFFGSIVSMADGYGSEFFIIDGQQRLTTISLLLLAVCNLIDENKISTKINKDDIQEDYLINEDSKDEKKIRLKPVKNDKEAFDSLFKTTDDYLQNSNITANYLYFYNIIEKEKEKISIDELFSAIQRLVIVDIKLKRGEDDPQLIFESLNSTGLDLTEADKVRNFILMKENPATQEKFYNDYWNKIEENTDYNVSDFIRHYLTIKERSIPNKNKVYLHFKNYINVNNLNNEELLLDLLKYSKYYKKIITTKNDEIISRQLSKINRLESVVTYPFLMEVLDDYEKEILVEDDLVEILETIISFVFRRLICEVPTNSLNNIFKVLGREIKKYDDYKNKYLEIFKLVITQKRHSQRFPDDKEFASEIMTKDIYNFKNKNKLFLLEQLENFKNKERSNIEELVSTNELTIEHIMPQTLTRAWKNSLGENHNSIHDEYLDTLGNITLTGYNSKMSNKLFIEKRDMDNGFKQSRLYLNGMLSEVDKWDKESIVERAFILKDKALKIWKYPNSNYQSTENKLKSFTLDDDEINFTGEKVSSFSIRGEKEIKVDNWKNFYKEVSEKLFSLDPIKFRQLAEERNYINREPTKDTLKIDIEKIDNFHLHLNLSSEAILARLRILANGINLDLNDVSFVID